MENNHPISAFLSTITSIFSATLAVFTLKDMQIGMAMGSSFIAMLSGCFAVRYYYLASKKFNKKN